MKSPAIPLLLCTCAATLPAQNGFVQWETPHVHPIDMTPDGTRLLAVNTADARLEIFDLTGPQVSPLGSVQVGIDPVTVRVLTDSRAWVVNHVSDTISVVDIGTMTMVDTIFTPDEPCDVVFTNVGGGGTSGAAWVSCSQPDIVARFDLANTALAPTQIPIVGEEPCSMAASPDGSQVYVAIRESGNNTTILNGGTSLLPNIVSDPNGPYMGVNPPPNSGGVGGTFVPGLNPLNPPAPPVGLIVRKDLNGNWMDDNGGDWSSYVSGANANQFGRIQNWDLADHDLAIIDTTTQVVTYATGTMNIVMSVAIQPSATGHIVSLVGTDCTNEIRFEPNLNGTFVRVMGALVDPTNATTIGIGDLNPALVATGYQQSTLAQSVRDQSLGDPRFHVWDPTGSIGWIAGMGSNNLAVIDAFGNRFLEIEVGQGPTGIVADVARTRLYVLNKFSGSVSVVDAATSTQIDEVPFHDPTPLAVKKGRKFLYDTHLTSGLGQSSCGSCHVDARTDRMAWDLGNPEGDFKVLHAQNINYELTAAAPGIAALFHPMKGPMTTQTLQDIIGKEPFHWRGDRKGIEEFTGAYTGLLGDDQRPTAAEMQSFEDLLASIWFPPNPFRAKNNDLSQSIDLSQLNLKFHDQTTGVNTPLPIGDARRGLDLFMPTAGVLQDGLNCVTCHVNPVGKGADFGWNGSSWVQITPGAHGERHLMHNTGDPNSQAGFQISQLRNMHEKTGFDLTTTLNTSGFGYMHDGAIDTISHFVSESVFGHTPGQETQEVADLTAFLLSYSSSDLPLGNAMTFATPPGPPGLNSHAGIGFQYTVKQGNPISQIDADFVTAMLNEQAQEPNDIAIIVKQNQIGGGQRGYTYLGNFNFQTDQAGVQIGIIPLILSIGPGTEATFTAVPTGTEVRLGVDRDGDGAFDADEVAAGTDPASARSVPPGGPCSIQPPAAPSNVVAVPAIFQVALSWVDNATNETGFAVERQWTNSPQWEVCAELPANMTTFTDTSAAPLTGYVYRVRAYNCAGESATASSAAVNTGAEPTTVTCHVHAIDLQLNDEIAGGTQTLAYGTVNVVDTQGRVLKDANVNITVTGPTSGTFSAVTNDQGQAVFIMPATAVANPSWTFTVNSITNTPQLTVIYNPSANFVTSATVP